MMSVDPQRSLYAMNVEAQPEDLRCEYAQSEYRQLARFRNLFRWLVFALLAATTVFLIFTLVLISVAANSGDDGQRIIDAVLAAVSAAGTIVTGVAAKVVFDLSREQQELVDAALVKLNECLRSIFWLAAMPDNSRVLEGFASRCRIVGAVDAISQRQEANSL